jgi:branched-chain amino acid transport system ATP-binding protein
VTTVLEIAGLSVTYGRHRALKGVDLRVAPGEVVVMLGANGAGKTSLLKAVAGLVPAQGAVRLDGKSLSGQPPHRVVEAGLALVPEGRGIFGDLTVRENLLLGAFAQRARADQPANLERVLGLFPRLAERSGQIARTMSGGEQQMVAIGRALMSAPVILMLDEPSLGLSPLLCAELFRTLKTVRDTGVGILLVEQNARQSLAIADRAYLLENGEIVGQGAAADLARDPAVQAAYLGGAASPAAAATMPASLPAPASAPAATVSADALVPTRIAELVRIASLRQAKDVEAQRGAPNLLDPGTVAAAMAGVEAAAARAVKAPAAAPPGIEVWHRPGLEIWRRQPDGGMKQEDH